jgi:hypothetical protein
MANNWQNYYPRHDKPNDPNLQRLVQAYCDELFPGSYDKERGVLDFGTVHERLKGEVAPITDEERRSNPGIRFFEKANPEWRRGVELPCIGEISIKMLIPYLRKEFEKGLNVRPATRGYVQPVTSTTGMTVPPPAPRANGTAPAKARFQANEDDKRQALQQGDADRWNDASRGDA